MEQKEEMAFRKQIREVLKNMDIKEDNLYPKSKKKDDEDIRTSLMKVLNYTKQTKEEVLKNKYKIKNTIDELTKDLESWKNDNFGEKTI